MYRKRGFSEESGTTNSGLINRALAFGG